MDGRANIVAQAQITSDELRRDSISVNSRRESRLLEDEDVGETEVKQSEQIELTDRSKISVFPYFVIPPKDTYILSNQKAVIEARVSCVPKPIVRWYKNGQLITSALFPKIKKQHFIPELYTLEIPDAIASDIGSYTCVARNSNGSISSSATLRIVDLETDEYPRFLKRLKRTDVPAGRNGRLVIRVTGVPKPEVEWFKNSMPLKDNKRFEIRHIEPHSYVIHFNNATAEDAGVYTCEARNSAGTISTSAMVCVEENEKLKVYEPISLLPRKFVHDKEGSKDRTCLSCQLERRQCPYGWSQRELDNHLYRLTLANYHIKYRTETPGYSNLF